MSDVFPVEVAKKMVVAIAEEDQSIVKPTETAKRRADGRPARKKDYKDQKLFTDIVSSQAQLDFEEKAC